MKRNWYTRLRKFLLGTCVAVGLNSAAVHAGDADTAELRQLIEAQNKQIQELKQRLDAATPAAAGGTEASEQGAPAAPAPGPRYVIDEGSINKIVADYLQANPGSGMPYGVSTGYYSGTGFVIRSQQNPTYNNWQDESKIPFDLHIRGRIQADYYFYKVADNYNHLTQQFVYPNNKTPATGGTNPTGIPFANSNGDFSQLELKRLRLIFEGNAFDPNLRYHIQFDGGTRGLTAASGGSGETGVANDGTSRGGGAGANPDGNGIAIVDHSVRLLGCYIAYDWHPSCFGAGCGCACPDTASQYAPTVTGIVGKFKPSYAAEEMGGSGNAQFVEFGIVNWMFDTDDDNYLTQAALQFKAMDDRFFGSVAVTNANESQTSALQDQRLPGAIVGAWYDFGGNWNETRKAWDLYGEGVSDLYYSCCPVFRAGLNAYFFPGDRRTEYSNITLGRQKTVIGGPGSTSIISELGGAGNNGFAVDAFDTAGIEVYVAGKWRGFSFLWDNFMRDLDNFRGEKGPGGFNEPILYTANAPNSTTTFTALFNKGSMLDFGSQLQGGYFIVPKKFEVAARFGWVAGQSGSPNGTTGQIVGSEKLLVNSTTAPPTVVTANIVKNAFDVYRFAEEYEVGFNWYFKGQAVKWMTDVGYYTGGWGGGNGQSPAGFIPGDRGWLLRTQMQLWF